MKPNKVISALLCAALVAGCLIGCAQKEEEAKPDFSGYKSVTELATLDCSYHNVAEISNDGSNILFGAGPNLTYKKGWFEYDGKIKLGIDVSKVNISDPDENGNVTITVPQATVIGLPDIDDSTLSDVYEDTGFLADITAKEKTEALSYAQECMKTTAENDQALLTTARDRAKNALERYVKKVGELLGKEYTVTFVDAE